MLRTSMMCTEPRWALHALRACPQLAHRKWTSLTSWRRNRARWPSRKSLLPWYRRLWRRKLHTNQRSHSSTTATSKTISELFSAVLISPGTLKKTCQSQWVRLAPIVRTTSSKRRRRRWLMVVIRRTISKGHLRVTTQTNSSKWRATFACSERAI